MTDPGGLLAAGLRMIGVEGFYPIEIAKKKASDLTTTPSTLASWKYQQHFLQATKRVFQVNAWINKGKGQKGL